MATLGTRVRDFLERRVDRDGEAEVLQDDALRLAESSEKAPAGTAEDRASEVFAQPQDLIDRSLALKLLDGWLQNRHQTLIPLTFRMDRLSEEARDTFMRFAAAVLLDASSADPQDVAKAERWLRDIKATQADLATFATARQDPRPLSALLRDIQTHGLEAYAYAAAAAIGDTRSSAGHLFASYIAARLQLPADGIRSIDRRYRR